MVTLDPDTHEGCKALYTEVTGKDTTKVSRLMFILWFIYQIADDAMRTDWDGILTIHFLSTKEIVEIPSGKDVKKKLFKLFKRLLTKRQKGSAATDDFEEIVQSYLSENNPYGVFFLTDGSLTDQDEFYTAYQELAPAIVEHGGNDEDFGVVMLVASDKASQKLKKLKKFDDQLPSGVDLFDAADLRETPPDVAQLLHMAAHG